MEPSIYHRTWIKPCPRAQVRGGNQPASDQNRQDLPGNIPASNYRLDEIGFANGFQLGGAMHLWARNVSTSVIGRSPRT